MPVSITKYLKIKKSKFKTVGALDTVLDTDSKLFIDPKLVESTKAKELSKSYSKINTHFKKVIKLLLTSRRRGDPFWRAADKLLTFPEVQGLCIGYSKKGTNGSGMGQGIRKELLDTAKVIADEGVKDPEIFELVGLIHENVGPDRISDMIAGIILHDLLKYSENNFSKLSVKVSKFEIGATEYKLPLNPFNKRPIILLPKDILRDLPIALDWSDIDFVTIQNEKLRESINALIGSSFKAGMKEKKRRVKKVFETNSNIVKEVIKLYKRRSGKQYDYDEDPAAQIKWYLIAEDYSNRFPEKLILGDSSDIESVEKVVIDICNKYKDLIEKNGLSKNLYGKNGKIRPEAESQRIFFGIAEAYCEANNLDLSPESDSGRGSIDFKVSAGYNSRVLVEVKLTTNKSLNQGFEKQLPTYQEAERTKRGIYLVIDVGASQNKIDSFWKVVKDGEKSKNCPKVIWVDGEIKPSASKA